MNRAMWIAKTGLDAQQTRLANISNNLANVSTSGFKRSRAVFEDLLYQNVRQVGAQSSQDTQLPSGLQLGTGARVVANEKVFTQGNFVLTENPLDIAVEGRGFFQVLLPDGTISYTRDGSFQLSADGQVVTSTGYTMEPAVTVPADALSLTIGTDGTISVLTPGATAPSQLGNLQLADFVNPTGLQAIGKNLFIQSAASGDPQTSTPGQNGVGTVVQGTLESSNVNVVEEMVNMIETQRAYEMNSKAIATADQMLQFVNQTL